MLQDVAVLGKSVTQAAETRPVEPSRLAKVVSLLQTQASASAAAASSSALKSGSKMGSDAYGDTLTMLKTILSSAKSDLRSQIADLQDKDNNCTTARTELEHRLTEHFAGMQAAITNNNVCYASMTQQVAMKTVSVEKVKEITVNIDTQRSNMGKTRASYALEMRKANQAVEMTNEVLSIMEPVNAQCGGCFALLVSTMKNSAKQGKTLQKMLKTDLDQLMKTHRAILVEAIKQKSGFSQDIVTYQEGANEKMSCIATQNSEFSKHVTTAESVSVLLSQQEDACEFSISEAETRENLRKLWCALAGATKALMNGSSTSAFSFAGVAHTLDPAVAQTLFLGSTDEGTPCPLMQQVNYNSGA
jgi:hypothetical protein